MGKVSKPSPWGEVQIQGESKETIGERTHRVSLESEISQQERSDIRRGGAFGEGRAPGVKSIRLGIKKHDGASGRFKAMGEGNSTKKGLGCFFWARIWCKGTSFKTRFLQKTLVGKGEN